jgi:hypothetical protein
LCHSYGEKRATTNIVSDTRRYAAKTYSHISTANGFMKENRRVGWDVGTWDGFKGNTTGAAGRGRNSGFSNGVIT